MKQLSELLYPLGQSFEIRAKKTLGDWPKPIRIRWEEGEHPSVTRKIRFFDSYDEVQKFLEENSSVDIDRKNNSEIYLN